MKVISAKARTPLAFDAMIDDIRSFFPTTCVTKEDWYADRIARLGALAERILGDRDALPVRSARRAAAYYGTQREIEFELVTGVRIVGRLDARGVLFVSNTELNAEQAAPLLKILNRWSLEVDS